jgi:hypothetical protein
VKISLEKRDDDEKKKKQQLDKQREKTKDYKMIITGPSPYNYIREQRRKRPISSIVNS